MENIVVRRTGEEEDADARALPIMRTLARFHECDAETLYSRVDASEVDIHDMLWEMVARKEVAATPGNRSGKFALTLRGWAEYMRVLGSLYELPE